MCQIFLKDYPVKMKAFNWMLPPLLLLLQGALVSSSPYGKYINTPCTAASDCGLDTHLQCINSFCQCDSFTQIYDQSTQKCLLLLGQQCQSPTTSQKHHHNYHHETSAIKCVPHADCTKGSCRCKTGYKPSVDFLCKPDYGSPCHVHDDCDDGQGLLCTQGLCQCFNSTWQYQGQFGCVDPKNPQYNEMLGLLNQTEFLLKENDLELKDMFNDLGLQNDPDAEFTVTNVLASARQFQDTYNTNDLQFAAQNTNSQTSGGRFNLQQLLTLFQTFRSLIPRNPGGGGGGGGGGGFLRNLFRGAGGGGGGGYPDASTTPAPEYGPPAAGGYGPPGQPEGQGMGMRMGLLNNFLRLFNQMIPIVRQLRMRFNPVRFFQNIIMRFSPTTTAAPAPAPAAIHNAPPTIIASNGNYQSNPIFESGQAQQASPGGGGGGGRGNFRFFTRTRDRFRNFLRRPNQGGGGGGGYDYTPANPPDKYGPPASGYGPPAAAPPPAEGAADAPPPDSPPPATDPPAADAPAGNAPQNYYTNNPRTAFQGQSSQPQYSTVRVNSAANQQQYNQIPQSSSGNQQGGGGQQGFQSNQAGFSNQNSYSAGHQQANPPSFFQSQHNSNKLAAQINHQQLNNNNHIQSQHNSFNAQPTSHHQSTFVPHPQPSNTQPYIQNSNNISPTHPPHHTTHVFDSSLNSFVRSSSTRVPSVTNSPSPPPIPQFKLQVPQHHHNPKSELNHESLSQNFILSEADDPHPGFTPLSTAAPQPSAAEHHGLSFRTSARFERIGQEDHQPSTAAENWRETF